MSILKTIIADCIHKFAVTDVLRHCCRLLNDFPVAQFKPTTKYLLGSKSTERRWHYSMMELCRLLSCKACRIVNITLLYFRQYNDSRDEAHGV